MFRSLKSFFPQVEPYYVYLYCSSFERRSNIEDSSAISIRRRRDGRHPAFTVAILNDRIENDSNRDLAYGRSDGTKTVSLWTHSVRKKSVAELIPHRIIMDLSIHRYRLTLCVTTLGYKAHNPRAGERARIRSFVTNPFWLWKIIN